MAPDAAKVLIIENDDALRVMLFGAKLWMKVNTLPKTKK